MMTKITQIFLLVAIGLMVQAAKADPDVNDDGIVNFLDVAELSRCFLVPIQDDLTCLPVDQNADLLINFLDLPSFSDYFLQPFPAPDTTVRYFTNLIAPIDARAYVTAVDINGDGFEDIFGATGTEVSSSFNVAYGDGAGSFPATSTSYVACADPGFYLQGGELIHLDADNEIDFVAICGSGSANDRLTIFSGLGNASFERSWSMELTGDDLSIELNDFDGNGRDDVFVGHAESFIGTDSAYLFENTNTGQLSLVESFDFSTLVELVRFADVNNDSYSDLLTVQRQSTGFDSDVLLRLGDGTGGFASSAVTVAANVSSEWMQVVDFNGDSWPDIVVCCSPNANYILGDGQGGFTYNPLPYPATGADVLLEFLKINVGNEIIDQVTLTPSRYIYAASYFPVSPPATVGAPTSRLPVSPSVTIGSKSRFRDVTSDGLVDLLAPQLHGVLVTETEIRMDFGITVRLDEGLLLGSAVETQEITIADFNADGILDLANINDSVSFDDRRIGLQLSLPEGDYIDSIVDSDSPTPRDIDSGHLNADLFPDIAVARGNSGLTEIYFGDGEGQFSEGGVIPSGGSRVIVTDTNDDGIDDLVTKPLNSGLIEVLLGDGQGNFSLSDSLSVFPSTLIESHDLNGDGINELVGKTSSTLTVYLGTETNGFVEDFTLNASDLGSASSVFSAFHFGDLNHDGVLDLFIVLASSGEEPDELQSFAGVGDGTFALESSYPVKQTSGTATVENVGIADIDGDSFVDVVMTSGAERQTVIYFGLGDFTFDREQRYAPIFENFTGPVPNDMVLRDMNGDGGIDIVHGIVSLFDGFRILYNINP